ncbi:hypothetical protein MUP42_00755 [Candidatus Bathyarchaeota archaeon]|nr:hypothetical protein [Candidatus Bathyarchaeota archaeon]
MFYEIISEQIHYDRKGYTVQEHGRPSEGGDTRNDVSSYSVTHTHERC